MWAIFICVFVETIICASIAEHPSGGSSTRLGYEQDGAASSKSSAIASLGSGRIPRQSRCIRCSYSYDDRYSSYGSRGYPDDYYGRQYGSMRNYYDGGATSRGGYDDRNWYYYTDRYDDRLSRYPDRYGSSALNVIDSNAPRKYDDRYASRTYDRYDIPYGYNDRSDYRTYYNDYRGNGYDNRDYYRGDTGYYRDRFYDRYRGGYGGYEGRYNDRDVYDRYYSKGSFDYRNYRPWDETYSGESGFDNSGRGYYFAGRPNNSPPPSYSSSHYRPAPPPPSYSYHDDERNSPPRPSRPYSPHAPSRPLHNDSPNSSGSSSGAPGDSSSPSSSQPSAGSSSSSASGPAGSSSSSSHRYPYNDRPSRPEDDSKRGYAGGWNYLDDRDKDSGYHDSGRDRDRERDQNRDREMGGGRDKDSQSTAYGPRPRPLGGAYLLDRDTNTPVAVNGGNKDSKMEDQPKVSAVEANDGGSTGNSGSSSSSMSSSSDDSNKN
ncbi:unnamed protein product [Hermetia illucens]|uniref:Uncharacterized protein n=1 Tax=Hermetia illucens TaxID=343691 RepID=A0A7R8YLL4_HERIL|nr:unnamed protein product [Hermetia illucens]